MRYTRIVAKVAFIIIALIMPLYGSYGKYKAREARTPLKPIKTGVYGVDLYVINKDTVPALISNKQRWNEVIFDIAGLGSMKNIDACFMKDTVGAISHINPTHSAIQWSFATFHTTRCQRLR